MSRAVTVPPVQEPISLFEAKDHLRVSVDDEDLLIYSLIKAARKKIESDCNRYLITQTVEIYFDRFPRGIMNLGIPIQSVQLIHYIDASAQPQTLPTSDYSVDERSVIGRVATSVGWPATSAMLKVVTVTVIAGYGDSKAVPENIKHALLLLVGHLFENREMTSERALKVVPMAYEFLIEGERVPNL